MKRLLPVVLIILLQTGIASAQQYKWLKGGGSVVPFNAMVINTIREDVKYMCTDGAKNVYVLCQVFDTAVVADAYRSAALHPQQHKLLLASYDCNSNLRWAKTIECATFTYAHGLKYYQGRLYVAGTFLGPDRYIGTTPLTGTDSQRTFLARFDLSGNLGWIKFAGMKALSNSYYDQIGRVGTLEIDDKGILNRFLYLNAGVPLDATTTSRTNIYDLRYDTSGNLLTSLRLDIDTTYSLGKPHDPTSMKISKKSGKIYAVLNRQVNGLGLSAVCAFSATGALLWIDTCGAGPGNNYSFVTRLYYDGNNGIYVTGRSIYGAFRFGTQTANNSLNAAGTVSVVLKLDTAGATKWVFANEYDNSQTSDFAGLAEIAPLPDGRLVAGGEARGSVKHGGSMISLPLALSYPFYTILDTAGNLSKFGYLPVGYSTTSGTSNYISSTLTDTLGNIYFGGAAADSVSTPSRLAYKSRGGLSDFFIAKYGYNCECAIPAARFTSTFSGTKTVNLVYSGTTPADSVLWHFGDGATSGQMNPSHTYTGNGPYNICVTVYASCGVNTSCRSISSLAAGSINTAGSISIYPNPATGFVTVEGAPGADMRIINTAGQRVIQSRIGSSRQQVDIRALPAGIYMMHITSSGGTFISRVVVK